MSERVSDGSWFPKPPPKPLKAPSAATLLFASVIFAVAVAGVILWLTDNGSGQKTKAASAPAAATVGASAQSPRQAFADCMRSMGAGSGSSGRGRFNRGPSESFRNAYAVCRSLIRPQQQGPVSPPRTSTAPAPIA